MTSAGSSRSIGSAPGPLFHALVALPALLLLWAASFPGYPFLTGFLATAFLGVAAIVWLVRAVLYWRRRAVISQPRSVRWFLVAPLAGVLALGLMDLDVPMRTRWALAKSEFVKQLPAARADPDYRDIRPHRLGTYNIVQIERNHDAVIFTEASGAFSDDAGFAYLPRGPQPELENGSFERPQWVHLGGHWYAWVASW